MATKDDVLAAYAAAGRDTPDQEGIDYWTSGDNFSQSAFDSVVSLYDMDAVNEIDASGGSDYSSAVYSQPPSTNTPVDNIVLNGPTLSTPEYQDIPDLSVPVVEEEELEDTANGYDAAGIASQLSLNTDGLSYVDADNSTVAGQLNSLLSTESPYITQARLAGEKTAASRGMLNSNISAGTSEAAAIQAALPIAQQDAQTYADAQGRQQAGDIAVNATVTEGIVSSGLSDQNADIASTAQSIQNQFSDAMQAASEANQVLLTEMQNTHTQALQDMEIEYQTVMQEEAITAAKAEMFSTQASSIMQNYQISVENMLMDGDLQDLGTAAMNNMLANAQTLAKNSIKFVAASAGLSTMDAAVDQYLQGLSYVIEPEVEEEVTEEVVDETV